MNLDTFQFYSRNVPGMPISILSLYISGIRYQDAFSSVAPFCSIYHGNNNVINNAINYECCFTSACLKNIVFSLRGVHVTYRCEYACGAVHSLLRFGVHNVLSLHISYSAAATVWKRSPTKLYRFKHIANSFSMDSFVLPFSWLPI